MSKRSVWYLVISLLLVVVANFSFIVEALGFGLLLLFFTLCVLLSRGECW